MRKIQPNDLEGKTIKKADCSSQNVIHLEFSDGEKLSIWAEMDYVNNGHYLPIMLTEEETDVLFESPN